LPADRVDRALLGVSGAGGAGDLYRGVHAVDSGEQPDLSAWCDIDDVARVAVLLSDDRVDGAVKHFLAAAFRLRAVALNDIRDRAAAARVRLR